MMGRTSTNTFFKLLLLLPSTGTFSFGLLTRLKSCPLELYGVSLLLLLLFQLLHTSPLFELNQLLFNVEIHVRGVNISIIIKMPRIAASILVNIEMIHHLLQKVRIPVTLSAPYIFNQVPTLVSEREERV